RGRTAVGASDGPQHIGIRPGQRVDTVTAMDRYIDRQYVLDGDVVVAGEAVEHNACHTNFGRSEGLEVAVGREVDDQTGISGHPVQCDDDLIIAGSECARQYAMGERTVRVTG